MSHVLCILRHENKSLQVFYVMEINHGVAHRGVRVGGDLRVGTVFMSSGLRCWKILPWKEEKTPRASTDGLFPSH